MKNPVIKKGKRYYNTLTKKYISKTYAKRLNAYFKKHPEKTLYQAGGHGKYVRKIPLSEHGKDIKRLAYGSGTQIIRTKTMKKHDVFYSPFQDELLTKKLLQEIEKLDYFICNNRAFVELFRLTRERENIYHIVTWTVNQRLTSPHSVDFFEPNAMSMFNCIIHDLKKIAKKYRLGRFDNMYVHVASYFHSAYDGWEKGKTIGYLYPSKGGFDILKRQFKDVLNWYRMKLDSDSYHNITILTISFYIFNSVRSSSLKSREIAKYRIGVNRLYHLKPKTKKEK